MKCLITVTAALIVIVATTPNVVLAQEMHKTSLSVGAVLLDCRKFCSEYNFSYTVQPEHGSVSPNFFAGLGKYLTFSWQCSVASPGCEHLIYKMVQEGRGGFPTHTVATGFPSEVCHVSSETKPSPYTYTTIIGSIPAKLPPERPISANCYIKIHALDSALTSTPAAGGK